MINWMDRDWSYLLGVIHGDGNVSTRSIRISVGYKDQEYADILINLWCKLGFDPKVYRPRSAMAIDVHNKSLTEEFRTYKSHGRWSTPLDFDKAEWLAGIFDTDGTVSLASRKCAIIIGLKQSGNLLLVRDYLSEIGIPDIRVHNRISKFNGRDYPVEELRLTSFEKISIFAKHITLRNPRKVERLRETIEYIGEVTSRIPLWKQVGLWLQEEPRTWEEIAIKFNLTKDQVDSIIQNLRRYAEIKVILPPRMLSRYHVSGLSSSQEQ